MRKIILLLPVILIMTIDCSKNEPPQPVDLIANVSEPLNDLLIEYKLLNKFDGEEGNITIRNLGDSLIYFSGKLKDSPNIGLVVFNRNTKEKLVDLVPFKENTITLNKPYGETITITIKKVYCEACHQNGRVTVIRILGTNTSIGEYNSTQVCQYLFLYDDRITKTIDVDYCSMNEIYNWRDNLIIYTCDNVSLFSPLGELLMSVTYKGVRDALKNISQDELLSDFEGMYFDGGNSIIRFDLRKEGSIWSSRIDLSKLDRPRIDNSKLTGKTDSHFTYEIAYTEYSGNKGVIKFRVNIETGEIEYL